MRPLLLQRHAVFDHLQRIVLRVFAQQLKKSARDNQLVRLHLAEIGLALHAIDEARERLAIEALPQIAIERVWLQLAKCS